MNNHHLMGLKSGKNSIFFTQKLLKWNADSNSRQMPWKNEKDPYKIWLSEIILQQTRVEQGTDYYNRFVKKYPTIEKLAAANETEIFKLWEGLGYYSRCKNLIATAKLITKDYNGSFPKTYEDILALKGVGPYTASAIASFAYNLNNAVVDGNVMRVLARYFAIEMPIDTTEGKKKFNELANNLLKKGQAGIYNQAIMDFGATICKPKLPGCENCILSPNCSSFQKNTVHQFPIKSKTINKKERWFYYLIANYKNRYYIRKRVKKDIWQNLHEFILIENESLVPSDKFIQSPLFTQTIGKDYTVTHVSGEYHQKLTHQTIHGIFIHLKLKNKLVEIEFTLAGKDEIEHLAFPRMIAVYLKGNEKI